MRTKLRPLACPKIVFSELWTAGATARVTLQAKKAIAKAVGPEPSANVAHRLIIKVGLAIRFLNPLVVLLHDLKLRDESCEANAPFYVECLNS